MKLKWLVCLDPERVTFPRETFQNFHQDEPDLKESVNFKWRMWTLSRFQSSFDEQTVTGAHLGIEKQPE